MKPVFPTCFARASKLACLCGVLILLGGCSSSEFKTTREKAEKGDPKAQLELGFMYLDGRGTKQSDAEGLRWCREAAEKGLPAAQRAYGLILRDGIVGGRNLVLARQWLEKAATKGDVMAQVELANTLAFSPPPQDYVEVMKWLILAEKAGSTNAPAIIKQVAPEMSPAEMSEARAKAEAFEKEK